MMKRALVTGATGFVGSHLVEALRQRGVAVTALVLPGVATEPLERLGVQPVRGSLDDHEVLRRAAEGHDVVFHVAGLVAARSEAEFLRVNRDGTAHLVRAAEQVGRPRFVLVSSMTAAGSAAPGARLDGQETPHPVSRYSRSKLAGEEVVRAAALPWTIIRPPMVYGPRERDLLKVFRMVRRWGLAPVFGNGSQQLSAVYAPDLAESMIAAAGAEATTGRIYYPCHAEVFSSSMLVRAIAAACARPRVRIIPVPRWLTRIVLGVAGGTAALLGRAIIQTADKTNEYFQPAWVGDPSPLERDAGWRAKYDLASGLEATFRWYRELKWL
jgi:nucleoside-diphosphate-sugar epimerase